MIKNYYCNSLLILFLLLVNTGCSENSNKIKYLALGDSYTIGEGVEIGERWPNQLALRIGKKYNSQVDLEIVAKTGFTSAELLDTISKINISKNYDFVSLLIGVNNQYKNLDILLFQKELNILMDKAINFASGNNEKVFVLSIPDWGITPFGVIKKRSNVSEEIDAYNKLVYEMSSSKGIQYYDITDISRKVNEIDDLLTGDKLHPSPLMYSMWVDKVIDFFD
jgi:lysophospholipase L1-like esterase|tara:strand:- start:6090 stop:6758 length:669 start_codon:yes stop_codon:yes gene_type:complete